MVLKLSSQNISTLGRDIPYTFPKYKEVVYDNSHLNITYELTSTFFSGRGEAILAIGNNFSSFSDVNEYVKDSLLQIMSDRGEMSAELFNIVLNKRNFWKTKVIKNKRDSTLVYQRSLKDTYRYAEKNLKFDWVHESSSKKILGYTVNKAKVRYRGRNYIAWYTTDIPIVEGPYVFSGLPGLILEIHDTEKKMHLKAFAIDKKPKKIYLRDETYIIHTSRDKFRAIQKSYTENPAQFMGDAYNEDGTKISIPIPSRKYDPMELE